ncbi:MAG: hypothetical protein M3Z25_14130 [Actinomycetota bacterium]|nr:hypothetical protein [Actinomycetota bacterium]
MSAATKSKDGRRGRTGRSVVAAAQRSGSGRGWWISGGVVVGLFAIAVAVGVSNTGRSAPAPTGIPAHPILTATGRDTPPPWPTPADVSGAVRQAGLPMLVSEGVTEHIHAHLDILVAGKSPVQADFSLGQFFTEWQVALSATQLGGLHTSDATTLRAYVNGSPVAGDPAAAILHAHDEIALVYGPADAHRQLPTSYAFPRGE